MFPSECVLERRVRSDGDQDLAATDLPLFILKCEDRKAEGYAEDKHEIYSKMLEDMVVGVRLADRPPAVSYLAILGAQLPLAEIVAVDKTVIVIRFSLDFTVGGDPPSSAYLIYDAVALSLHMIPALEDPSLAFTLSSSVSVARPCHGPDYALIHTGKLVAGGEDSLFLWRPSSSSPPWSDYKKTSILYHDGWNWNETNTEFSFDGHAYWVDLLCGVFCFSCDALFDDDHSKRGATSSVVKFTPLPVKPGGYDYDPHISEPAAYRTMGVVRDSFIRFASINGFEDYVELKDRTVTVWKLLGHDEGWEEEHRFSLEALWGFEGFGDVPKDLTPMYPHLSTKDTDVLYLGLGEYSENIYIHGKIIKKEFFTHYPRYMLAIDMRNKIVRTSLPLDGEPWISNLVYCGFSRHLCKALVGPCDDGGVPIPMKKPRLEKPICC